MRVLTHKCDNCGSDIAAGKNCGVAAVESVANNGDDAFGFRLNYEFQNPAEDFADADLCASCAAALFARCSEKMLPAGAIRRHVWPELVDISLVKARLKNIDIRLRDSVARADFPQEIFLARHALSGLLTYLGEKNGGILAEKDITPVAQS